MAFKSNDDSLVCYNVSYCHYRLLNFKAGILGVQCPVNNAESGFNTRINLNILNFFFLDVLICLIKFRRFQ